MDQPPVVLVQVQALPRAATRPSGFAEGVWHPEDLLRLEGTPWIIVSAMRSMRGRGILLAVNVDARQPAFELEWRQSAERDGAERMHSIPMART